MDDNGNPTLGEEDMELAEIAIAVQIKGSSTIDSLYRGYPLRDLEFAYQRGEGEGVRTENFFNSHSAYNSSSATIKMDNMSEKALAPDEGDLNAFLQEKGKGVAMQVKRKVQRDEEATVNAPHVPEPPSVETPQPTTPSPKQTSLSGGRKLSDIVEGFLG
jgi:hypothetical protein